MESASVEYRFNSCGDRSDVDCGPKPVGAYRIVMIGSSFDFGMFVAREKSFAAVLPDKLSSQTSRPVELYNEAMQWGFPASAALRIKRALAEHPDMLLWVLTPTDIASSSFILPYTAPTADSNKDRVPAKNWDRVKLAFATLPVPDALSFIWDRTIGSIWSQQLDKFRASPTGILLQHLMYRDRNLYIKSYLMQADSESGFLKRNASERWKTDLQEFDKDAAHIEEQTNSAGVPLVAVLVPNRAQAAMISSGEWPPDVDPYKLNNELRAIIESHGGVYLDILPDFRAVPDPEKHYYPVDGHPDPDGHAMIATFLARALTSGAIPALKVDQPSQIASTKGQ
jgi:hypothetical protein